LRAALGAEAMAAAAGDLSTLPLEQRTLQAVWRRAVEAWPERTFVQTAAAEVSYAAFDARVGQVAAGLSGLGLAQGAKLALMLRNSLEFIESWFAAAQLGALYVPINTDYKGDILAYQLGKADVTHIVIDVDLAERLAAVAAELPKLVCVVLTGDGPAPVFAANIQVARFPQLRASGRRIARAETLHTDPHAISFTSGTTGPSKGVLATNCHVITFALDWIEACGFRQADRLYSCLPMFHAIATWLGVLPVILTGATYCFVDRFSASRFWDDVRRFNASVVHGIFSMVPILLKQPPRSDDKDVPARLFYIGQRNPEFEARFNCRIVEVYGATETGIVTYSPLGEAGPLATCGRENSRTYEVALVDDHDQPVPVGEVGEIVVRPRQPYSMIQEYYNMPAETLAAFRNLWFHTGDKARQDANGYFQFVDRKKDAMRRRGENISSWELEKVVGGDPRVLECAAVAHPSDLGEDEVKMVIVPQPGAQLSAADVWDLCEDRMPRFWVPRYLEFRDALPKTPNGKVQKYLLRQGVDQGDVFDRLAQKAVA
jgi:carnitine-CoA ligase